MIKMRTEMPVLGIRPALCWSVAIAFVALLSLPCFAQVQIALENAPAVHLGDDEAHVRSLLGAHSPMYSTPFSPGRFTLKAGDGVFVDFQNGKVVEVDVTNKSIGEHLGAIAIGSDLTTARVSLGIAGDASSLILEVVTRSGEVLELRAGADHRIAVIALIADSTHVSRKARPMREVMKNSG